MARSNGSRAARSSTAPPVERVEVAAAVVASGGRYLIAQRRLDQEFPLFWEFPGGKREPGEAWDACLVRELREELGVGGHVGGLIDAVTHEYPSRTVSLRFYRCDLDGEPRPLACHDLRWVTARDLALFEFPAADAALVAWLRRRGGTASARVTFSSTGRSVLVPRGTLLEEAAARTAACIPFGCRIGSCGACRLVVREGGANLSRATRAERATLRGTGASGEERLGCMARVFGDVIIEEDSGDRLLA